MKFYDINGQEIQDAYEYVRLFANWKYKRVGETFLKHHHISTVWVGLTQSGLLETKVFFFDEKTNSHQEVFTARYCTLKKAKEGHEAIVEQYTLIETKDMII